MGRMLVFGTVISTTTTGLSMNWGKLIGAWVGNVKEKGEWGGLSPIVRTSAAGVGITANLPVEGHLSVKKHCCVDIEQVKDFLAPMSSGPGNPMDSTRKRNRRPVPADLLNGPINKCFKESLGGNGIDDPLTPSMPGDATVPVEVSPEIVLEKVRGDKVRVDLVGTLPGDNVEPAKGSYDLAGAYGKSRAAPTFWMFHGKNFMARAKRIFQFLKVPAIAFLQYHREALSPCRSPIHQQG